MAKKKRPVTTAKLMRLYSDLVKASDAQLTRIRTLETQVRTATAAYSKSQQANAELQRQVQRYQTSEDAEILKQVSAVESLRSMLEVIEKLARTREPMKLGEAKDVCPALAAVNDLVKYYNLAKNELHDLRDADRKCEERWDFERSVIETVVARRVEAHLNENSSGLLIAVNDLVRQFNAMKSGNSELLAKVEHLQGEVDRLQREATSEGEAVGLRAQIVSLHSQVAHERQLVREAEQERQALLETIRKQGEHMADLEHQVSRAVVSNAPADERERSAAEAAMVQMLDAKCQRLERKITVAEVTGQMFIDAWRYQASRADQFYEILRANGDMPSDREPKGRKENQHADATDDHRGG